MDVVAHPDSIKVLMLWVPAAVHAAAEAHEML
jgi:hypothetical protein